jgi:hypothetical protein
MRRDRGDKPSGRIERRKITAAVAKSNRKRLMTHSLEGRAMKQKYATRIALWAMLSLSPISVNAAPATYILDGVFGRISRGTETGTSTVLNQFVSIEFTVTAPPELFDSPDNPNIGEFAISAAFVTAPALGLSHVRITNSNLTLFQSDISSREQFGLQLTTSQGTFTRTFSYILASETGLDFVTDPNRPFPLKHAVSGIQLNVSGTPFLTLADGSSLILSVDVPIDVVPDASIRNVNSVGFNVNSDVTFVPLDSTYQTTTSVTGCPQGFSGQFIFAAALTNKTGSPAMPNLTVRVVTLTNGNLLLDPQTNQVLGGEGTEMTLPHVGTYADGLLSPGESVDVPFALCLKTFQPFQFFADVFGVVTQMVSVNRFGTGSGNGSSFEEAISPDGRFVAFSSFASDLTADDDINGTLDAFVRDLQTGTTTLVSVNRFGTGSGNGSSTLTAISAGGRFATFQSDASDLTANDTNGTSDVFVRDLQMGTTTLVSVNRFGTGPGNGFSLRGEISADGRFVTFGSLASDLTANDTNGTSDVFVRDLQTGTTTLVSVNRFGTGSGNRQSFGEAISADGRFVAFESRSSDLTAEDDANSSTDVFVRDLQTGTTTLASVNRFGTGSGNSFSEFPAFSATGRFVAFTSDATDLTANDTSTTVDAYVRDLQTGTTTLVSVNRSGTASGGSPTRVSVDGRLVAFRSGASDLTADHDTIGTGDVFVRDVQMGTTTLVSVNRFGTGTGNLFSLGADLSADGRFVAFESLASDLTADNDTQGTPPPDFTGFDVFVRDLQMGTTTLMSINRLGTGTGNRFSRGGDLSADGRFVAFESDATDLVATDDTNGQTDVFVRPVAP